MLFTIGPPSEQNAPSSPLQTLITTGDIVTNLAMKAPAQRQIIAAGGTTDYNVGLINDYNQDYPAYNLPEATIMAWSSDPVSCQRTFTLAVRMVNKILTARQDEAHVPLSQRIGFSLIAPYGPAATHGSRKRAIGGLLLIGLVLAASARTVAVRWQARRGVSGLEALQSG